MIKRGKFFKLVFPGFVSCHLFWAFDVFNKQGLWNTISEDNLVVFMRTLIRRDLWWCLLVHSTVWEVTTSDFYKFQNPLMKRNCEQKPDKTTWQEWFCWRIESFGQLPTGLACESWWSEIYCKQTHLPAVPLGCSALSFSTRSPRLIATIWKRRHFRSLSAVAQRSSLDATDSNFYIENLSLFSRSAVFICDIVADYN